MNLLRRLATSPQLCIISVVVVLYTLAFNPYVPPQNGDDISYYQGALSIVAGDGFTEQGKWIVDWPPVESSLVALAMLVTGLREYYVAKIVHGIAVLISLLLAHRLIKIFSLAKLSPHLQNRGTALGVALSTMVHELGSSTKNHVLIIRGRTRHITFYIKMS